MVVGLEGKENCFWRLHKPIPFQYGRADCVRDESKATKKFPFSATDHENHANPFGQGDSVLKELKRDFGMSARHTIALMAAHGISTHAHNKILGIHYRSDSQEIFQLQTLSKTGGEEVRSYLTCTSKRWAADHNTTWAMGFRSSQSGERRVSC